MPNSPRCLDCNQPLTGIGQRSVCSEYGQVCQVYPLKIADNHLMQVLLDKFTLTRVDESCVDLAIQIDRNTPAIRRRETKRCLKERMPHFDARAEELQQTLEALLIKKQTGKHRHDDKEFVFRYSNGGALPVVRSDGKEYYCLFYRDVEPVGWNIANGASDTLEELLNPTITIEREFCEELIVIDVVHGIDYLFSWGAGETIDRPEFAVARKLWWPVIQNMQSFERRALPVQWQNGPDTVRIKFNKKDDPRVWSGGYLNINALDFGIEVDRIAYIELPTSAVLLDGEINNNQLINRPIGLFESESLEAAIHDGNTAVLPDIVFFDGVQREPASLEELISDEFLPRLVRKKIRNKKSLKTYENINKKFGLCPATRQIIQRHQGARRPEVKVFTSYSHEDVGFTRRLVHDLKTRNVDVWRDADDLPLGVPWDKKIQEVLRECSHVLVISTPQSVSNRNVLDEANFAIEQKKTVIPVLLKECELPLRIHRLNWADFRSDYPAAINGLLRWLCPLSQPL